MKRQRLQFFGVVATVIFAVALVGGYGAYRWWQTSHRPDPNGHLTVRGLEPGMSVKDVTDRLGKPTRTLGTPDKSYQMFYDRQGTHDPEVFCSKGRVDYVEGTSLESNGRMLLHAAQMKESAIEVLGSPDGAPQTGSETGYQYEDVQYTARHLKLTFVQPARSVMRTMYFGLGAAEDM